MNNIKFIIAPHREKPELYEAIVFRRSSGKYTHEILTSSVHETIEEAQIWARGYIQRKA